MVLEGAGICLMAGFSVQDDLEAGRLVRLLPEYRPVEMSMNAVYPHRHHLSAEVRTFIDMLVEHSAEQQKLINPYSLKLVRQTVGWAEAPSAPCPPSLRDSAKRWARSLAHPTRSRPATL